MDKQTFFSRTKREPNGCLTWTRSITRKGYGELYHRGKMRKAHRVAWEFAHGELPSEFDLHHLPTCKKSCCEVSHLVPMSHSDHAKVTNQSPTFNRARGMRHGMAKLTDDQCREMIALHSQGYSQRGLARLFNVGESTAHRIVANIRKMAH